MTLCKSCSVDADNRKILKQLRFSQKVLKELRRTELKTVQRQLEEREQQASWTSDNMDVECGEHSLSHCHIVISCYVLNNLLLWLLWSPEGWSCLPCCSMICPLERFHGKTPFQISKIWQDFVLITRACHWQLVEVIPFESVQPSFLCMHWDGYKQLRSCSFWWTCPKIKKCVATAKSSDKILRSKSLRGREVV